MNLHLLGIRHHGPGSAKRLIQALEKIQPDVILIEGPQELDSLIPYVVDLDLMPPIAALIYNPKDLKQAVYFPFAEFSPEWQTYLFALQNQTPLVQMDLPQSLVLGLREKPEKLAELEAKNSKASPELQAIAKDPLGYMAALAGYSDSERWWEIMFEHHEDDIAIFESILKMMTALRGEIGDHEQAYNLIREAHMRKVLRKAIKDGFQNIAIVCGAWHSPALADWKSYKVKDDNALLKGIPKIKTKATWIPWTYDRIASSSGYGAGVVSPAWYELLYNDRPNATIHWMAKVAQLFQKEDLDTSSAHAIEATRLARTLATLRGLSLPGIEELSEAVVTVFCNGYETQLELIKQRLIIGTKMGQVPASIPIIPLQQNLEAQIKKLKLSKYKKAKQTWLKANSSRPQGGLDLRQDFDLKQSHFLHRLTLLEIPFGRLEEATGRELSTKNEYWQMEWKPEFSLRIIEAGMWGNDLETAATRWVLQHSEEADTLVQLTELLQKVMKANLPLALDELLQDLRNIAAITKDIEHLMAALPSLVYIHRYGDVRQTKLSMVAALIQEIIPRICISLPMASTGIDDDASQVLFDLLLGVNKALRLLDDVQHLEIWHQTLAKMSDLRGIHAKIRGLSTRTLWDKEYWDLEQITALMSFELSANVEASIAGNWLEGFLYGSGLLLLHSPALWQIIDQWVSQLGDTNFQDMLPTLRKAFSNFSAPERQKMLKLVKTGQLSQNTSFQTSLNPERVAISLPILQLLLTEN